MFYNGFYLAIIVNDFKLLHLKLILIITESNIFPTYYQRIGSFLPRVLVCVVPSPTMSRDETLGSNSPQSNSKKVSYV